MKQSEKSNLSRKKILDAAICEFAKKSFENASVTAICEENNLSKGLLYHNYGGKNELYLTCVATTFDALQVYIADTICTFEEYSANHIIAQYFSIRHAFFHNHPMLKNIFYEAMFHPPLHLREQIRILHQDLAAVNIHVISQILLKLQLREGVSLHDAEQFLNTFDRFYDTYFRNIYLRQEELTETLEQLELNVKKTLDFLLYGLAGRK